MAAIDERAISRRAGQLCVTLCSSLGLFGSAALSTTCQAVDSYKGNARFSLGFGHSDAMRHCRETPRIKGSRRDGPAVRLDTFARMRQFCIAQLTATCTYGTNTALSLGIGGKSSGAAGSGSLSRGASKNRRRKDEVSAKSPELESDQAN
jgi:hypothetical protein